MGAIEWTWLVWALENAVIRTAALIAAAVGLWKMLAWTYRTAKSAEALASDLAKMRAVVNRELTEDGNGSVKSKVNELTELMVSHLADSELQHHHLEEQLSRYGVEVESLSPRERWQWINRPPSQRDEEP